LILRPTSFSIRELHKFSLLAAVAVASAIKKIAHLDCFLKWPNDILIGDKKVGGILLEAETKDEEISTVVLGIGINVSTKVLPKAATALFLHTEKKLINSEILKVILKEIEAFYLKAKEEGFAFILREWREYCPLWGKKIKVKILDQEILGVAKGIDEAGFLILEKKNRATVKISSGDVTKVE